jgi:transcriptional regulator with XRE-family HTH domain
MRNYYSRIFTYISEYTVNRVCVMNFGLYVYTFVAKLFMMTGGRKLRQLRIRLGLNQKDFADKLDTSQGEVSRQEKATYLKPAFIKKVVREYPEFKPVDFEPDSVAEEDVVEYRRKPLISIDISHFEEQMRTMKNEMHQLQDEVSFLKELILQISGSDHKRENELTTG